MNTAKNIHKDFGGPIMKKFINAVSQIGRMPITFYKAGSSLVILALTGIYLLCEAEVDSGGVGVELYYAPMLDYILTTFLIFWAGMFLLDLAEREVKRSSLG